MGSGNANTETLARVEESGDFAWPWAASRGLAVISGAHGGGGGGGGGFCMEGLNVYGTDGGGGGGGGGATTLSVGERRYVASGGNGGGGGSGGGLKNGEPVVGKTGSGCKFGLSAGGAGGCPDPAPSRVTANGGAGGAGFPGETVLIELEGMALADAIGIQLGDGGAGGPGGTGFAPGKEGAEGPRGHVLLAPLFDASHGGGQ